MLASSQQRQRVFFVRLGQERLRLVFKSRRHAAQGVPYPVTDRIKPHQYGILPQSESISQLLFVLI